MRRGWSGFIPVLLATVVMIGAPRAAGAAWAPTEPIELVVPAGPGGGADQMARLIAASQRSTGSRLALSW